MKRLFPVLAVLGLLVALFSPVSAASQDISGGYYFVCDCSLGSGIKFWVPADFATDSLALTGTGDLINMTNSTIYLMPDDDAYSAYSISASRFQTFRWRENYGDYQYLNITAITETNLTFLEDTQPAVPIENILMLIGAALCILGCVLVIFRR